MSENTTPKKRRWYHNLMDAYRITARTYSWIPWLLAGTAIVVIALGVLVGYFLGGMIAWIIVGIMGAALADMIILSTLVRRAMYAQIDGTVGSVYAVVSQIRTGWNVLDQPVAVNKEQDVVWRLVGRPGIVLISEGPSSRVRPMLNKERQTARKVAQNVPIILIECGNAEGQVPLSKLESTLRKQKNVLTREEVPAVTNRLNALRSNALGIPKGIDPTKARPNRRAMRGR